jgi:hypothetical protein
MGPDRLKFLERGIGNLADHEQSQGDEKKKRGKWTIPVDRKEGAEEIIEEDRQYLEMVNP